MHTFFIAPTGFGVGLTSISLGLLRALERAGLKVGFFKPIAQLHPGDLGPERSSELVARTHGLDTPKPLPLAQVERMLGDGQLDELLEEIISLYQRAAADKDVVIVEGMVPTRHASYAARVNFHLAKSLDAEVILVSAPENETLTELTDRIEIQAQLFGGPRDPKVLGVILNKVRGEVDAANAEDGVADFARRLTEHSPLLRDDFRLIGCIPWQDELNAARTRDIADLLSARVINAGDYEQRRVQKIVLCARAVPNTVQLLKPGVLVVTPGDRDDIILAASLAAMNGVPLAGLLLCSDFPPDPRIMELCRGALLGGLPVLSVATGSYDTATNLNRMNKEIPVDDRERAERVTEFVAGHIDFEWLKQRCGTPRELRLSPSAFRYQVVQRAQKAGKRIVLPEGSEPRTVQAAAICQARGIARCVLLAKPEEVQAVAQAQGIVLPEGLEIIDPDLVRQRYVEPMVELRKGKGLNAPMAEQQLEDSVVLATMMLALDEVDGLVSGAIHTTASTIRPALQLIKTAPGYNLVSSVFFMLLPDQVLVYGDCAVNPDPSASDLAEIAVQSAASAQAFGIPARVAMISYSTGDSGSGVDVDKVREATRLAREQRPDLLIDGPLQYDAAAIASVGRQKAPNSPVAGQATVFIFPDLNTGNTTYKAVQRSADCVSVGPMLQGLRKPVNDLSRGALVEDIVYTIALTAIQADAQAPA
ncbi:phosphate acetyltransferase [Pseudomonas aeruginosa]|uniref:phosphate acetyltransferase n=1 Tax=Pseudomonas aeruginosa TaxID=287 RepID=UPI000E3B79A8|nr:phosphate acetyltransferase [Pseudomonas aeruginosa]MBH3848039.1 phosphate acetyltransferase [Pseudomonas aeruginosa]MBH4079221.1 phosphate acetyltransferase [Pseudomonas aeruginosa]MCS8263399.1 phosphate acetyltransferase [Pseudomonas aeruginosa]HCT4484888.1 phosphate acetyltransferase [Pseudomonas aeruginosa]HEJ3576160.1 phosphate acetyltransferase [Pseudomonas aeruginosa]